MQRKTTARICLAAAVALAVSLALAGGGGAGEQRPAAASPAPAAPESAAGAARPEALAASPAEDGTGSAADAAPGEAGLRVRLDPQTGEILAPGADPAGEDRAPRVDGPLGRLNTYGDDLLQEPLAAGGFRVDLRGRFQSSVVATIDPETDEVAIDCIATAVREEVSDDG